MTHSKRLVLQHWDRESWVHAQTFTELVYTYEGSRLHHTGSEVEVWYLWWLKVCEVCPYYVLYKILLTRERKARFLRNKNWTVRKCNDSQYSMCSIFIRRKQISRSTWTDNSIKGVSTAEGGRGHVTAYTMCTPSKIQMNGPDILNIDRSATE